MLGITVEPSGLTLMPEFHFIGASSDGQVCNTVIEIKCPSRGKEMTVNELIDSGYEHLTRCSDGSIELKESSPYFCQIQGEMAIKKCSMCHFVVWTPIDIEIISVPFNEPFWTGELLPKLKLFFNKFIRPELLCGQP